MMKVLFCGSRSWTDGRSDEDVRRLRELVHSEVADWVRDIGPSLTVIEGECRGPDQWAAEGALMAGLIEENIIRMPLDWKFGRGAGYKRNLEMLDLEPDYVAAFYNGKTGGTHHTVVNALKRNIPVFITQEDGECHYVLNARELREMH